MSHDWRRRRVALLKNETKLEQEMCENGWMIDQVPYFGAEDGGEGHSTDLKGCEEETTEDRVPSLMVNKLPWQLRL